MNPSWYDVLDVDPTASTDEVRAAWRAAVAELDPTDRRFRVVNQAAEVLLDPDRRAAHDAELASLAVVEDPAADGAPTSEAGPGQEAAPEPEPAPVLVPGRLLAPGPETLPEPAPAGATDRSRWPVWVVPGWLLSAVAALTALAVAFVLVLLTRPSEASVSSDTQTAQAAAERAIVPLLSYDAHHLDQSEAAATPYMTDNEKQQYDKLFAVIRQNAPRTGTVVKAKYVASGIVRSGTDRVAVLVFVNQVTTNKQHPTTPVVYKNQVTVTMAKQGDQWLVDDLTTNSDQP